MMTLPHPSVHFAEDLSSRFHASPSTMVSPNLSGAQTEPSVYQNPALLSPIQSNPLSSLFLHENPPDLSPVHENHPSLSFMHQGTSNLPMPQSNSPLFHPFIPTAFTGLQRFCADFSFSPQCSDTFTAWLFSLASSTVFLGNDVEFQL